jgi:hypothetical protein
VLTFIDFSKAFDSVDREKIFKILKANLLKTIMVLYTNTKAKVLSPDGETEVFEILMGVLVALCYREILLYVAPFLFVIILDYVNVSKRKCKLIKVLRPNI